MKKTCLLSLLFLYISTTSYAQLFVDNFDVPLGSKLTDKAWGEHSGNGYNPIITVPDLFKKESSAVQLKGAGQDINKSVKSLSAGTFYLGFIARVIDASEQGDYFLNLGPSILESNFKPRIFVKKENGQNIKFGISKGSNTPTYSIASFSQNENYLLVLKYTFKEGAKNDLVELMVSTLGTQPKEFVSQISHNLEEDDLDELGSIALRQGSASNAAHVVLDNLIIDTNFQAVLGPKIEPFANIQLTSNLFAFSGNCDSQPVFGAKVFGFGMPKALSLVSTSQENVEFSLDQKNWKDELDFQSNSGNYSQEFFVRAKKAPLAESMPVKFNLVDSKGILVNTQNLNFKIFNAFHNCEMSIKDFKTLAPNSVARVRGLVTASANEFGDFNYLQDATAGIRVNGNYRWKVGESLSVNGIAGEWNQETVILADSSADGKGSTRKFGTANLVYSIINIEDAKENQGKLVEIRNAEALDKNFVYLPNSNEFIGEKGKELEMRIWGKTEIPGYLKPQQPTTFKGVLGQFRDKIQLYPRSPEDIVGIIESVETPLQNPKEETFDLAAWNLEWFGNTGFGPINEELQFFNVLQVLKKIDADAFILTEVSNQSTFKRLVDAMDGYSGKCSDAVSQGRDAADAQRVCLLYKDKAVKLLEMRPLLSGTPPIADYPQGPDRFWAAGRLPALFVCNVSVGGVKRRMHIVGIHAKANRNGEEKDAMYQMRKIDIQVLKDSLDQRFSSASVILAGDYNDDVDETVVSGQTVSPYAPFVNDNLNWNVVSKALSDRKEKSYLGYDNVIDHITISNELNSSYIPSSVGLNLAFKGVDDYANSTSDHLPIIARFKLVESDIINALLEVDSLISFPNWGKKKFKFGDLANGVITSKLQDQRGVLIIEITEDVKKVEKKLTKYLKKANDGQYLMQVIVGNEVKSYKIVKENNPKYE